MSDVSSYSHCLFRTKDRPRMAQPSLRDFGYLLPNPTLERVGYSRISPPGDVSRKPHRLQQRTTGKCPNSRHPGGSESSSPDTEMIPLKTTENPIDPSRQGLISSSLVFPCFKKQPREPDGGRLLSPNPLEWRNCGQLEP